MQVNQEKLEGKISKLNRDVKEAQGWLTHCFIQLGYSKDTATYKAGGVTQDYSLLKRLNEAAAKKAEEQNQAKK